MNKLRDIDPIKGEIYLAGEFVPPGRYRQIGQRREVLLESEDFLPASLDGRVACYELVIDRTGHQERDTSEQSEETR